MNQDKDKGLAGTLVKGALIGAASLWLMDRLDWFTYEHQDPAARARTDAARPMGMDPAHVLAERIANAFGGELGPHEPHAHPGGLALHYLLGAAPAVLYAALRDKYPQLRAGGGSAFGLGVFLLQDELLGAVLGLSGDPRQYPWQAHARGLVAHVLYGVLAEQALSLLDRLGEATPEELREALAPLGGLEQPSRGKTVRAHSEPYYGSAAIEDDKGRPRFLH